MKNSEIKGEFKAKGLLKASEELDVMKLSKEERAEYDSYIEDKRIAESSVKTSWLDGKIEGKIEGKNERNIEIAIEMIKDGESNEKIRKYTSLTDDEIERLRGDLV